jgi:uncharacterized protein YjdB
MQYKVFWKASTREVQVAAAAAATPGGFTLIGTFDHPDLTDAISRNMGSHVIYQHVQEKLYAQKVEDMQGIKISWPGLVVPTSMTINDISVKEGETKTLVGTITPTAVSDSRMLYFIENEKIARVDHDGAVSGLARGETRVRVTSLSAPHLWRWAKVTVTPKVTS